MVSERVVSRSFIGRLTELEHLAARRRDAAEGRGGAVLVAGEAGIGKSRLIAEYRRRYAGTAPGSVAAVACRPFAQRPLSPIVEALSRLAGTRWTLPGEARRSKEALFDAIFGSFAAAAARRTRTVIIEDLHWADVELIQLLSVLAEQAAHRRLLFIGTYRDNEIIPSSQIFTPFARIVRLPAVTLVTLEALAGGELAELLSGMLAHLDVSIPSGTLEDVRRKSGGNPLFAEELMRHAIDAQRSGGTLIRALPISLHGVIRERLDRCTVEQRDLLSEAALFGRRFSLDLLCDVFERDAERARRTLRELRDLQLIDTRRGEPDAYGFRHALTRDAVYAELLPTEARRLHERLAETIAARPDASEHMELLAHSFWEAQLFARAAPYCRAAGDAAREVYAHEDAILWYERAARAFGDDGNAAARVLSLAAYAAVRLDDPSRAATLHERAIALYTEQGNIKEAVEVSKSLAGTFFNDARSERAIAVLRSTVSLAETSGDERLRAGVLVRLFAAYNGLRSVAEATRCAAQIDPATIESDPAVLAEYLLARSSHHAQLGEADAWQVDFESAIETLKRIDGATTLLRYAHGSIARHAQDLGEMRLAREHIDLGLGVARSMHSDESYMLSLLAEFELRAGNLESARGLLRSIPAVREFLARHQIAEIGVKVGAYIGDDDLIRTTLDVSLLDETEAGGSRFPIATLAVAFGRGLEQLGRLDEAEVMFDRAADAVVAPFGLASEIVTLAIRLPRRAAQLKKALEPQLTGTASRVNQALASLLDAVCAFERGATAEGRASGLDAAARFDDIGWPLLAAEALELGGDTGGALAIYRRTGAFAEVRRLERPALGAHAAPRRGVLTPRESEVARLVAQGKGNSAAARILSVSRKAVEKHLTSIYEKLGIRSRAQLAVYVASIPGDETAAPAGHDPKFMP